MRQLGAQLLDQRPGHGAARLGDVANRFQVVVLQAASTEQQRERRWHARESGHAIILHPLHHDVRKSKIVFEKQVRAAQQMTVQHGIAIGEMKRQHTQPAVARAQRQVLDDAGNVGRERAVAEHHAFGVPGRT